MAPAVAAPGLADGGAQVVIGQEIEPFAVRTPNRTSTMDTIAREWGVPEHLQVTELDLLK